MFDCEKRFQSKNALGRVTFILVKAPGCARSRSIFSTSFQTHFYADVLASAALYI